MTTIIIPSWNGCHLLKTLIPSLDDQLADDISAMVVDNGSTDETVEWLTHNWPRIKIIALPDNLGFAGAVNAGIKACGDDDVILLNNDTIVQKGWLKALISARDTFTDVHIFASRILNARPPYHIDTAGDGFTIAGFGYKIGWLEKDSSKFDVPQEVFAASGCSVLIRREVFNFVGLFDEDFFAFGEDLDFCFRARLAGFRVLYIPDAKVHHMVRATASSEQTLFWYHRNLMWLLCKNLPGILLLLYWPHILANILLVGVRSVFRGWFGIYIRCLFAAISGLPTMIKKRWQIQKNRIAHVNLMRDQFDGNWIAIHLRLHQARKNYNEVTVNRRFDALGD